MGVFDLLKENFDLPYSKKVIKTLIEQAGGKTRSTQWFDESKDNGTNGTTQNQLEPISGSRLEAYQTNSSASQTSTEPSDLANNHPKTAEAIDSASSVASQIPPSDSQKNEGNFSSEMVPAEMPTTPGFDLEPKNGSKDSSLDENLMPYLEAMASVGTPEELASFLECMTNLTQQQQEAVWQAAPVAVINQLERLGFDISSS